VTCASEFSIADGRSGHRTPGAPASVGCLSAAWV